MQFEVDQILHLIIFNFLFACWSECGGKLDCLLLLSGQSSSASIIKGKNNQKIAQQTSKKLPLPVTLNINTAPLIY